MKRNNGNYNESIFGKLMKNKKGLSGKTTIIVLLIACLIVLMVIMGGLALHEYFGMRKGGYTFGGGGGNGGSIASNEAIRNQSAEDTLANISKINNGNMPEITYGADGLPTFIDGKYSDVVVSDFSTAIMSVNDIKGLMGIKNPAVEYVGLDMYDIGDRKIYKFQQMYSGIPVYEKQLIIETDKIGKVLALCCDYDANINVPAVSKIPKPDSNNQLIKDKGYSVVYDSKLCVYNYLDTPILAWCVDTGSEKEAIKRIFISAEDGSEVASFDRNEFSDISAEDANGKTRTISTNRGEAGFLMDDTERGIKIFDCAASSNGDIAVSEDNAWDNKKLVSVAANFRDIYDYYKNILGTSAFRNELLSNISVYANYRPSDVNELYSNAICGIALGKKSVSIKLGDGEDYMTREDVAAHEFMHAVIRANSDLAYINESGAINEAYCNVLGTLYKNAVTGNTEWIYGKSLSGTSEKNIENPNKTRQPIKVGGKYQKEYCKEKHDHALPGCDNGGIHTNSSIVSHAIYLMYNKGINDTTEINKLIVKSLDYMVPSSDFKVCRAAILHAARVMNTDSSKIDIIKSAFDEVGIEGPQNINVNVQGSSAQDMGSLTGKIAAAGSKQPIASANINAEAIDNSGNNANTTSNVEGNFTQNLNTGFYRINISKSGYRNCIINNVQIMPGNTTYLENTVLLTEINADVISSVSGKITNAVSGEPVKDATVHFIPEWGNTSGGYAKDSHGTVIELLTNDNGEYFTDKLKYGYYTAEVSQQGYATQYVNVVASNEETVYKAQNVVLAPETSGNDYRITLEWDSTPRDEDAHIKGDLPIDFHVYYSNKRAEYNGKEIATLDHDDMEGNGFETITLTTNNNGVYKYFVHRFSGDGTLANSNAKVKVYQGSVMIAQFNVPTDQGVGDYWNVFEIRNGQLNEINEIESSEP